MKKLIILILICNNLYSQKYEVVDSIVKSYSNNVTTIDDLVSKINLDFDTNENKTRATFYWISNNINYDVAFLEILKNNGIKTFSYKSESERIKKEDKFILELANKTIKSKLAVCLGYSALFQIICKKLKIDCKIIKGNLKSDINQIGQNLEINHAWNLVKINNKWELVDCTLAAGKISTKTNLKTALGTTG